MKDCDSKCRRFKPLRRVRGASKSYFGIGWRLTWHVMKFRYELREFTHTNTYIYAFMASTLVRSLHQGLQIDLQRRESFSRLREVDLIVTPDRISVPLPGLPPGMLEASDFGSGVFCCSERNIFTTGTMRRVERFQNSILRKKNDTGHPTGACLRNEQGMPGV